MTVTQIKDLTKFLSEEEVENIKKEIKEKENILKSGNLDEEELGNVLNTLFSILVIEKTLEQQVEGIEEIREELENELLEAYQTYDSYMERSQVDAKKKKKRRWLLEILGISEDIRNKKAGIGGANKSIEALKKELNSLKQQRSNENLKDIMKKENRGKRREFREYLEKYQHCNHHERYSNEYNIKNERNDNKIKRKGLDTDEKLTKVETETKEIVRK